MTATRTANAWFTWAAELADWALAREFVRLDRCGGYRIKNGEVLLTTKPYDGPSPGFVTRALLLSHFRAKDARDILGAHFLTPAGDGSTGRKAAADLDNKEKSEVVAEANEAYACHQHGKLTALGFRPLILDWGEGSYHVSVYFDRDVPGADLEAFGEWLVADAKDHGFTKPVESFPKQSAVPADGCGNWLKLPGRHHKRNHYARVFDGEQWVGGEEAVAYVLSIAGDSPDLIPDGAQPKPPPPPPPPPSPPNRHHPHWVHRVTVTADRDVFKEWKPTLDDVVGYHEAQGHRVTERTTTRADFVRKDKDGDGQSFNVEVIDGTPITVNFSTNSGLPVFGKGVKGMNPAQVRCFYQFGRWDKDAMNWLAGELKRELGWTSAGGAQQGGSQQAGSQQSGQPGPSGASAPPGGPSAPPPGPTAGRDWSKLFIDSRAFSERDTRQSWLVKQILVYDQPGVIGGPQKTLKTTIAVDLVVSLAAGLPFLNKYETTGPVTVAMLSGESGDDSLKRAANRVAAAKGTTLAALGGNALWSFDVPRLTDPIDLGGLVDYLASQRVRVAIIDPLYLALLSAVSPGPDARSVYEMGPTFLTVATTFRAAGITPLLCHHSNRQIQKNEPMQLEHLAYAGIAEFVRQWILISRREPFRGDGEHKLWLNVGGSAGQCGLLSLNVSEGTLGDDFGGRRWEVEVLSAAEDKADRAAEREKQKADDARRRMAAEELAFMKALDLEVASGPPAATARAIRERHPAFSGSKVKDVADRLLDQRLIEVHEFVKEVGNRASRKEIGYRRPPTKGRMFDA